MNSRARKAMTVSDLGEWLKTYAPDAVVEACEGERNGLSVWRDGQQIGFIELGK